MTETPYCELGCKLNTVCWRLNPPRKFGSIGKPAEELASKAAGSGVSETDAQNCEGRRLRTGQLTRDFKHLAVDLYLYEEEGQKFLKVDCHFGKRKNLAAIRTVCSHIQVRPFSLRLLDLRPGPNRPHARTPLTSPPTASLLGFWGRAGGNC